MLMKPAKEDKKGDLQPVKHCFEATSKVFYIECFRFKISDIFDSSYIGLRVKEELFLYVY